MITVEIDLAEHGKCKEVVGIYFDDEGLDDLIGRLSMLKAGSSDRLHLMSQTWGLGDLCEKKLGENTMLVHHLKLTLIKKT